MLVLLELDNEFINALGLKLQGNAAELVRTRLAAVRYELHSSQEQFADAAQRQLGVPQKISSQVRAVPAWRTMRPEAAQEASAAVRNIRAFQSRAGKTEIEPSDTDAKTIRPDIAETQIEQRW